ncbi:MAG: GAF domain-containing protein, partial [Pseudomonadota bacterium]
VSAGGKGVSELLGKPCYEFFHGSSEPPAACPLSRLRESGTIEEAEMEVETLQGTYLISCTPVFDAQGSLEKIIHIATDITEIKRTETVLRRNRLLLELVSHVQGKVIQDVPPNDIFETMLEGFLKLTQSEYGFMGEVLFTPENRPYLKTHALTNIAWDEKTQAFYQEHAPKGLEFFNLDTLYGEALKTLRPVIADDPAGDPRSGGLPEGHPPLRSFLGIPLLKDKQLIGLVGIANRPNGYDESIIAFLQPLLATYASVIEFYRNRKAREELEGQLLQAQKMESVGRLAGGVAHDFNNMLSVIMGNAELALSEADPKEPLHKNLQEILNAAQRSAGIIRQLLAFARKQTIDPKVLDLNGTVEGMLRMFRRLIGEDIDLTWRPDTKLWPVKMDPSQIDQILANLCVNARDAISGTGKITIETENVVLDEAYCSEHAGFVPGEYVMLALSDDGYGMDKEILANVFEPFFTTKGVGKGTGLGLSTVYGIVRQNQGFVNVYSEPDKGTTFRIYLPQHRGEAEAGLEETEDQMPQGRGEIILIVEDEASVLKVGKEILDRLGYTVLAAGGPGKAMETARGYSGQIHLLLTDVVMPEMSGKDLAGEITKIRPNTKTLFMSGYTANAIVQHGILDKGLHFIQKPFTHESLARKIRELLDKK